MGASFRLFLVVGVLQLAFFDAIGVPFWLTVFITIVFVWIYTVQGRNQDDRLDRYVTNRVYSDLCRADNRGGK